MKEFLDLLVEGNDTSSTFTYLIIYLYIFCLAYGMTQSNHFVSRSIKMMSFSQSYNTVPNKKSICINVLCYLETLHILFILSF